MKTILCGQKYYWHPFSTLISLAAAFLFAAAPAHAFRAETKASPTTASRASAPAPTDAAKSPSISQVLLAEQVKNNGIQVKWNDRLGTPRNVRGSNLGLPDKLFKGKLAIQAGAPIERKAVAVLDNLAGLFNIQDAETEFTSKQTLRDALGFQHVKFSQAHSGLRVVGGELIVHFNNRGEAYEVNGQYIPDITLDVTPALSPAQAVVTAQQDLNSLGHPSGVIQQDPELVIYSFNSKPILAFELTLYYPAQDSQTPGRWRYWIDARNGQVIVRFNDIKLITAPTTGSYTNIGGSVLAGEGGGATNITGWYNTPNASYYLYNSNSHWIISNAAASGYTDNSSYAYRANTNWGVSDRTEISAANNFHKIQQYFSNVHARLSFNNTNAMANANVHFGVDYANAYWNGVDFTFGDGDGTMFTSLVVMDVAGHEFAHAVTEYSANLDYSYFDSGALSESFSDIFGACVEYHSQPDGSAFYPSSTNGYFDWLMGEDATIAPYRALRDMRNPSGSGLLEGLHPSRYKGANWDFDGEMHVNSTVQSFMFYLLSVGGSGNNDGISYNVSGISLTNAEQIAYRTLTVYLTQFSCYADAHDAWVSAATDLNTNWVASVKQAWAAVGFTDTLSSELGIAVNAPGFSWYTGGNTNWFSQSTITHDGLHAAQSGAITNDAMTKMYTTAYGPGTMSFWWKVSSEAGWDFLKFYIDDVAQSMISGEVDWQFKSYSLSAGAHVLKWVYSKDQSVFGGSDAGWVDEVTLLLPLVVYASSGTYADRVEVSWNPKADATEYELWRAQGIYDTGVAILLTVTTATSYTDTSVIPGITYYYWVKARTPSGTTDFNYYASGWRSWLSVPSGVAASDGSYLDKIQVTWTAAGNASSYTVYRNTTSVDTNASSIGSTAATSFDDTTATPNITYYYWVKGVDAGGIAGGFSLPDTGWRAAAPEPPDPGLTNIPVIRSTDFQMLPAVIQVGATPSLFSVRVSNTGTSTTSAWVTMTAYLSASGVFGNPNNLSMGSVQRYVSLMSEQSLDIQLTSSERANLRIPGNATLGNYSVLLKSTTPDATGTNNILTLSSTVKVIASRLTARDDFDGDGKTDMAVYNETNGLWLVRGSATGRDSSMACGGTGYISVSGDYDNDGKADLAVYHAASGTWLVRLSGSVYASATLSNFGGPGYTPVSGDFDGDGKDDPAIYQE
ncbi:MAG: M4 family metallopeptidase, partial [Verrucomicrobia bacterium]|nr:M4 family metallopeptidase [Verrucomicrobiota bacterium]